MARIATGLEASAGETALHFYAREGQVVARWAVWGLAVVTVVTMVTFVFWAIMPATLLIVAYLLLLVANAVERRCRRPGASAPDAGEAVAAEAVVVDDPDAADAAEGRAEVEAGRLGEPVRPWERARVAWPLLRHETLVISAGVVAVLILATIIAAILFGFGPMMVVAAFFLFAYIMLLTSPVWFAALEEDIEAHS